MNEPRRIDKPRPGYFKGKIVKNGPMVGARIFRPCHCTINGPDLHDWRATCDRFPQLAAEIDGSPAQVDRVWTMREEIDAGEYVYLVKAAKWDRDYDPTAPAANPDQAIDLMTTKAPF